MSKLSVFGKTAAIALSWFAVSCSGPVFIKAPAASAPTAAMAVATPAAGTATAAGAAAPGSAAAGASATPVAVASPKVSPLFLVLPLCGFIVLGLLVVALSGKRPDSM